MELIGGVSSYPARVPGHHPVPRGVRLSSICRACGKQTVRVTYSRVGRLGRARTRRCTECGSTVKTLEAELVPGLRRAIARILKAQGVQLDLPFG